VRNESERGVYRLLDSLDVLLVISVPPTEQE